MIYIHPCIIRLVQFDFGIPSVKPICRSSGINKVHIYKSRFAVEVFNLRTATYTSSSERHMISILEATHTCIDRALVHPITKRYKSCLKCRLYTCSKTFWKLLGVLCHPSIFTSVWYIKHLWKCLDDTKHLQCLVMGWTSAQSSYANNKLLQIPSVCFPPFVRRDFTLLPDDFSSSWGFLFLLLFSEEEKI